MKNSYSLMLFTVFSLINYSANALPKLANGSTCAVKYRGGGAGCDNCNSGCFKDAGGGLGTCASCGHMTIRAAGEIKALELNKPTPTPSAQPVNASHR